MSTPTKTSVEMPALPRYTVACASDEYGAHWHVESYSDGSLCLFSEAEAALRERDEFWRGEVERLVDDRDSWMQQASARTLDALNFAAERDAALADAARLREALESINEICNETRDARDRQSRMTEIRAYARAALKGEQP